MLYSENLLDDSKIDSITILMLKVYVKNKVFLQNVNENNF